MLQFNQNVRELRSPRWSVGEIASVLKYQHRIIIISVIGCLSAALLFLAVTPKKYIATAVLLTETRQAPDDDAASSDAVVDSTVIESQMEAVRSGSLALRVIDELGLADDPEFGKPRPGFLSRLLAMSPIGKSPAHKANPREIALDNLQAKLKIDRIGRSYVAEIDATSIDAEKAAKIANAIADGYIEEQLGARQESQLRANKWMQDRLVVLRDQATRAEKAARDATVTGSSPGQTAASGVGPADNGKVLDLAAKARIARAGYEAYLNRYTQALQLQKVAIPSTSARVLTRAIPPNIPGSPRTTLVLALSLIAGCTLGTLGAFGAEFVQAPVRSRSQLSTALGVRAFEPLPLCRVRTGLFGRDKGMPIVLVGNSQIGANAAENELRKIKIALSQFDLQKPTRAIGVTSPTSHDGKTTVAYNLALLSAQSGSRTLLIDANLRNPTLAKCFCERDGELFTKFITGVDEALTVVRLADNLSFVGQSNFAIPAHPADILSCDAMHQALQRAQGNFDYIIIDLPAMLDHVDARAIAPLLDRVLMVCRWGSPIADLERCLENADVVSSRLLGIVINQSPEIRSSGFARPIKKPEQSDGTVDRVEA